MSEQKVAIVTGGGGAIGRETACGLTARGFAVLVVDIDLQAAEATVHAATSEGGTASAQAADISDDDAVAAYVDACVERYGNPCAFFNNAGYLGDIGPIPEYSLEEFDRTLAVNVRGTFLGLRHVIPAMMAAGGGAILNTASQAGLRGVPHLSGYATSKHAVVGLSRSAALECAPDIRVNTLCPGPTDTGMMDALKLAVEAKGGDASSFVDRVPMGRYADPRETGAFASWLLAEAPAYITGAELPIDGGMTTA
jgi:NAD(P)-dependent dehydrogenase (short-subunit alcohol dehydrogenase family)